MCVFASPGCSTYTRRDEGGVTQATARYRTDVRPGLKVDGYSALVCMTGTRIDALPAREYLNEADPERKVNFKDVWPERHQ